MSKETLKQIKEQYARELHYRSWQFMCEAVNIVPRDVSVIAERYAASQLIEAQERIKDLENSIQNIIRAAGAADYWGAKRIANEALSPVNPKNK